MKNTTANDRFFEAILSLQDIEECRRFFGDVCTPKEIQTLAQRFTVAEMLHHNCVYSEIVEATGASTATVSRVSRSMHGLSAVFERLGD